MKSMLSRCLIALAVVLSVAAPAATAAAEAASIEAPKVDLATPATALVAPAGLGLRVAAEAGGGLAGLLVGGAAGYGASCVIADSCQAYGTTAAWLMVGVPLAVLGGGGGAWLGGKATGGRGSMTWTVLGGVLGLVVGGLAANALADGDVIDDRGELTLILPLGGFLIGPLAPVVQRSRSRSPWAWCQETKTV